MASRDVSEEVPQLAGKLEDQARQVLLSVGQWGDGSMRCGLFSRARQCSAKEVNFVTPVYQWRVQLHTRSFTPQKLGQMKAVPRPRVAAR